MLHGDRKRARVSDHAGSEAVHVAVAVTRGVGTMVRIQAITWKWNSKTEYPNRLRVGVKSKSHDQKPRTPHTQPLSFQGTERSGRQSRYPPTRTGLYQIA